MLRIPCPWCGERDETEFRYRGDGRRPAAAAGCRTWRRSAPTCTSATIRWAGIVEWWLHVGGCRRLLLVVRHTLSHEIRASVDAAESATLAPEPGA